MVAADSRGTLSTGGSRDDYQKFFPAGRHAVVALVGVVDLLAGDSSGRLVRLSLTRRIARLCGEARLQKDPQALITEIVAELRELRMLPFHCALPRSASLVDVLIVGRGHGGYCCAWRLSLPIERESLAEPKLEQLQAGVIPSGGCHLHGIGLVETVQTLGFAKNPDDSTDSEILAAIDKTFAAAAANPDRGAEIGGPIDVAVIDSSGFRWLRCKP